MFDSSKSGKIEKEKVRTILNTLGHTYDDSELDALLAAEDTEGKADVGAINHTAFLYVFASQRP